MKVFKSLILIIFLVSCKELKTNNREDRKNENSNEKKIELIEKTYLIRNYEIINKKKFDCLTNVINDSIVKYCLGDNSEFRFITKFIFISDLNSISFIHSNTGDTLDISSDSFDSVSRVLVNDIR